MTGPRLKRRNYGRGHGYQIDGQKVTGVTTVLNSLPKDALINWSARVTAEAALDRWDELAQMSPSARLKELTDARWNITKEAALRGTQIHDLGEKLSHGEKVKVPDEHVGPVEAYARFLDEWDVTIIATEAPCGNTRAKYAGTLDSIGTIGKLGGITAQIDLKTGKGVYESAALQLEAYARCDIWQPDGPESEQAMPEIEALYIAHILPDTVNLLPVVEDRDALYKQFRYVQMTTNWLASVKDAPPIGAPLELLDDEAEHETALDRIDSVIEHLTERRALLTAAQNGLTS